MKIKVIFWGDESFTLNRGKCIKNKWGDKYYERVGQYLVEYMQISKNYLDVLYKEIRCRPGEETLLMIDELTLEDASLIQELKAQGYNLSVLIKNISESTKWLNDKLALSKVKCYSYIPGIRVQEVVEMFPIFLESNSNKFNKQPLRTLDGSTLLMGYEQEASGLGELAKKIFENWQYIERYKFVKISLYSKKEIGLQALSELEDAFNDYTAENAKLEVESCECKLAEEQVYFLIEGTNGL